MGIKDIFKNENSNDEKEELSSFQKLIKYGSWIFTVALILFMFINGMKNINVDELIESSQTEEGRMEYIQKRLDNNSNEKE